MPNTNYGYVYLLTNSAMPGMVKIGMTQRDQLEIRIRELYTTGVPLPFECLKACKVPADKCSMIESSLHIAFNPYRVNPNREFFRIMPEQVIAILNALEGIAECDDATQEVQQEINDGTDDEDKAALERVNPHRRPALNFAEMGIGVGEILVWRDDASISVRVVSDRKVEYQGQEYSISPLTSTFLGYSCNVGPCKYWKYKDRHLDDIYDETYPLSE